MSGFEQRNAHFDRLFATNNLFWLGQNTNHLPMHPRCARHCRFDRGGGVSRLRAAGRVYGPDARHRRGSRAAAGATAALITDGAVAALATVCRAYCEPGRIS